MKIKDEILCKECGKQIFAINLVNVKDGVELPAFMHAVCYERIKEFQKMVHEQLTKLGV